MTTTSRWILGLLLLGGVAAASAWWLQPSATKVTVGAETPLCGDVDQFAARLQNVGIAYDYEPSNSPRELADRSSAVFSGRLTGRFESFSHNDRGTQDFVGFELEVNQNLRPFRSSHQLQHRQFVSVAYNAASLDAGHFRDAISTGASAIVFAHEDPTGTAPGGLITDIEGFALGCGTSKVLGLLGGTPAWTSVQSLDDLATAISRAEVELWHCGISPMHFDGRAWEVPNDEEPFDGTNAPDTFAGQGSAELTAGDELRFVDDGGQVLRFVPDDGVEPPCA